MKENKDLKIGDLVNHVLVNGDLPYGVIVEVDDDETLYVVQWFPEPSRKYSKSVHGYHRDELVK